MKKIKFDYAGIRLKTARLAAGFKSAKEFCDKYGIPSSTYSLHETGGRNLKPQIAEKYAELLGVNSTWLLTGSVSPYAITTQENPLTHDEFMELLKYHGNEKIKQTLTYKNEFVNINPLIFCKIIMKMIETLKELNFNLEITQLAKKTVEMYKDIEISSSDQETQLIMVDLSITTFKRQIKELLEDKQESINE